VDGSSDDLQWQQWGGSGDGDSPQQSHNDT